jgi:hypothetical protein
VEGQNPIQFSSLDDYIQYLEIQRKSGINCPVLYLQQENNAQGQDVYRMRPSPFDLQGGLPAVAQHQVTQVVDANRLNAPYNTNNYPGFDPQGLAIKTETKRAYVESKAAINAQGEALGLQVKDEFISLNGLPIDMENFGKNMKKILQIIQRGDMFTLEVARPNELGGYTSVTLKAPCTPISQVSKSAIRPLLYPTPEQLKLRADWMRANP